MQLWNRFAHLHRRRCVNSHSTFKNLTHLCLLRWQNNLNLFHSPSGIGIEILIDRFKINILTKTRSVTQSSISGKLLLKHLRAKHFLSLRVFAPASSFFWSIIVMEFTYRRTLCIVIRSFRLSSFIKLSAR